MNDLVILGASTAVVLLMVGVAAALGFREGARIDAAALERIAAAERVQIQAAVLDLQGQAGLARLADGRFLFAKVMADGVSARVTPPEGVRMRLREGTLRVVFGDVGFPAVSLRLAEAAPEWLEQLAAGATS